MTEAARNDTADVLSHDGRTMPGAIACQDWSQTSLGPMGQWPVAAATMVSMMLESQQPMFLLWGPERTLVYNDANIPLLGGKHPAALGQPFLEIWAEASDTLRPLVDHVFEGGSNYMDDFNLMLERGEGLKEAHFIFSHNPVRNGDGSVGGLLCVCTETTDQVLALRSREEAEARLRESEDNYRHAVELNPQIAWTASADGQSDRVSERWADLTGCDGHGMKWSRSVHPDDFQPTVKAWLSSLASGAPLNTEHRIRMRSGEYRWFRSRAYPRFDGEGRVVKWYGTTEDIHDRKIGEDRIREIQSELLHMSRYTALGEMASALAHELNQPLTAIANYLGGCRKLLESPAAVSGPATAALDEAIEDAAAQAMRAGAIIRSLRTFVSRTEGLRQRETLGELVKQACTLALAGSAHIGVELEVSIDPDLHVYVDRIQIQQVLLNLMRNAIEAMQGRPVRTLSITASASACGTYKEVVIEDTGGGIAPDILPRLFQPFQTSKPDGMGVGLSICRTIVEAHGGRISATSMPEKGTLFRFTLPKFAPPEDRHVA